MGLSKFLSSLKLSNLAIPRIPHHRPRTSASIIFLRSFRFSIPSNGSVPVAMPIHGGLTETLVGTGISETPADNIARDVETLCKIASNQSISNMEVSLGQVSVRVSPLLVKEVLKKLSNGGVIALTFFRWAEKQKGYQHDNESYNLLIDSLGKIKQFKMIWGLVGDMRRRKLLSKDTFYLIMRRYARARKVKETLEAFEKMKEFGLEHDDVLDFNKLLDVLCKAKHVEQAQELFDEMSKRRFKPDVRSYTILLEGWGHVQNMLRLNEVYREMKAEGLEPDVVTYGIMINVYCKAWKCDEAMTVFKEMEAKNCKASPHIYCCLINGLGGEGRLYEAIEVFHRYKAAGFEPELPTYNAVVGAYCWEMRMWDVSRTIKEMKKYGIGPNARTYDIILHHLVKAGRTKEAYAIFQKMSTRVGCKPSSSTYEIIVRMLCNEDQVDMALRVWHEMRAKGVIPGIHMYSALINTLCQLHKLDDASKYFLEMLDMGLRPLAQMFSNLKQALLDAGRKDTALMLALKLDKLRKTRSLG
ncbi:unnamed protein product [Rhodiola kirilowii]